MKILLSPAKKMVVDDSIGIDCAGLPAFLGETESILDWLRSRSPEDLKKLWKCSDAIALQNLERLRTMDLRRGLSPAILSYDGIAYQYMAPAVFETGMLDYIQDHLAILSGFYGLLRPLDGVTPYRLEMQARADVGGARDLYDFWGRKLYDLARDPDGVFINLASREYSRCIEKYLAPGDTWITCTFAQEEKGALVQKGVYCKMARGEMVRYMAEKSITDPEEMKTFDRLWYRYRQDLSTPEEYVFLREKGGEK